MAEDLLEADLKDTAQFHEEFSGGFPEGADLEKDLGALVSYGVQDAFGFPVVDVPPQGVLRDLGAFLNVPEIGDPARFDRVMELCFDIAYREVGIVKLSIYKKTLLYSHFPIIAKFIYNYYIII
ncbi:hypothetical protein [Methanomethylovorans sp.]|uniref:hypothetical protein n=1 Tax=Methanomethylovorans sp. TaxID=2758717 RepID=UPI000A93C7E6|nr:hypothetical protein [Methanomethylovorans sp.]